MRFSRLVACPSINEPCETPARKSWPYQKEKRRRETWDNNGFEEDERETNGECKVTITHPGRQCQDRSWLTLPGRRTADG